MATNQNHRLQLTAVDGAGIQVGSETADFIYMSQDGEVVLPDDWTEIPDGMFAGCDRLTTLVIPDSVKRIGPGAFDDCPLLENVTYPAGLEDFGLDVIPQKVRTKLGLAYDANGFMIWNGWLLDYQNREVWDVQIPDGVIGISREAFRNDTYLDNVVIPDSVEIIAADAFRGCSYLQNLTVGNGVKSIGDRAFCGCDQLARFSSGLALETIGEAAFSNCWRMQSIALPIGMKHVDPTAFARCTSVTDVTTPSGVATLGDWFAPIVSQIVSVTVPTGETNVLPDMFAGCLKMTMVDLPHGVTNIGAQAFRGCRSLKTLTLPDTLVTMGEESFSYCSSLETFAMPDSVKRMGDSALRACRSLKTLTLSRDLPTTWPTTGAYQRAIEWWTPNQYDVTFDANGGIFALVSAETYVCEQITHTWYVLPPFEPTRVGYKFNGYWTERAGGTRIYSSTGVSLTKPHTLYAAWLEVEPPEIFPSSADGVVFETSQTITMTCTAEGATIHYTRDGSEPTIESPVYGRFRISGKTTIKARAFLESGVGSEIVTAEYALGRCPDPVIVSAGGTTFSQAGNIVTLNYACDEGVVRYTLDGSEPTMASPIYQAPFTVDDTVVVKAKAFSDRYFDSQVVTATLTRTRTKVTTPVIVAAATFTGAQTMVDITCATEGAVIYYTLNGSTPNSHSTHYRGPFAVDATTTIKAYATYADCTASDVVTKTVTKIWGIGDSLGAPDQAFAMSGAAGWVDDGGTAMKSGRIANGQRSVLSTVVAGAGSLSFEWKTSCELDEEFHEWDHLELKVDGAVVKVLDGITGWIAVEQQIEGAGNHTVEWIYVKDDFEFDGEDCAWVRKFAWLPSVQATQTTGVPVPYAWLRGHFPTMGGQPSDYEAKGKAAAANGRKVWECYVAGEDPNDPASEFAVTITLVGENPVVTWSPDLGEDRIYTVFGASDLNGQWVDVTSKAPAMRRAEGYRFFKVEVRMK